MNNGIAGVAMVDRRIRKVGRFKVEVELSNNDDLAAVRRGDLPAEKVRRVKVHGWVDSGASHLILPTAIAKKLGLSATGKVKVTYANNKSSQRDMVEGVYLDLLGRHSVFRACLEPKRDVPLIGAIVLEDLDLLVDPGRERVYPRDPEMEVSFAE
jgi:predicted aspartyl protease